jgi:hypothetical protein
MTTPNATISTVAREVKTTLKLSSSGLDVVVHKGTGRDILAASRMIDTQRDGSMAMVFALCALKCTFNGERKTYEELLDLSDDDAFELMGAVMGKASKVLDLPSLSPGSSPPITSPN